MTVERGREAKEKEGHCGAQMLETLAKEICITTSLEVKIQVKSYRSSKADVKKNKKKRKSSIATETPKGISRFSLQSKHKQNSTIARRNVRQILSRHAERHGSLSEGTNCALLGLPRLLPHGGQGQVSHREKLRAAVKSRSGKGDGGKGEGGREGGKEAANGRKAKEQ